MEKWKTFKPVLIIVIEVLGIEHNKKKKKLLFYMTIYTIIVYCGVYLKNAKLVWV